MSATTRTPTRPVPRPRALGGPARRRCASRPAGAVPVRGCTARSALVDAGPVVAGPTSPPTSPPRARVLGPVRLPCAGAGPTPAPAAGSALVPTSRPRGDAGMATAEYAVATLAACGFAGLLVALLASGEVRELLLGIIQRALTIG